MSYIIWELKQVYYPDTQGIEKPRAVMDDDNTIIEFETIDGAREYQDELNWGPYYCQNNESGRPDYIITDSEIDLSGFDDLSNYNWDGCDCSSPDDNRDVCAECAACIEHMINQECEYIRSCEVIND